jgi:hypothetical protein
VPTTCAATPQKVNGTTETWRAVTTESPAHPSKRAFWSPTTEHKNPVPVSQIKTYPPETRQRINFTSQSGGKPASRPVLDVGQIPRQDFLAIDSTCQPHPPTSIFARASATRNYPAVCLALLDAVHPHARQGVHVDDSGCTRHRNRKRPCASCASKGGPHRGRKDPSYRVCQVAVQTHARCMGTMHTAWTASMAAILTPASCSPSDDSSAGFAAPTIVSSMRMHLAPCTYSLASPSATPSQRCRTHRLDEESRESV